jgi:hypothetical protein
MKISARQSFIIGKPRADVFEVAVACDTYPRVLHKLGPIPGIARCEMIDGRPLEPGACRRVVMTNGSVLNEELLAFTRPTEHRYIWRSGLRGPFAKMIRSCEGRWLFSDTEGGTKIDWMLTFELTTPLAYPIIQPMMPLQRRWMRRGLERMRDKLLS